MCCVTKCPLLIFLLFLRLPLPTFPSRLFLLRPLLSSRSCVLCGAVEAVSSSNLADPLSIPTPPVDGTPAISCTQGII